MLWSAGTVMMARGRPVAMVRGLALAAVVLVVTSAALLPMFGLYVPAGVGLLGLVFLTWRWPEGVGLLFNNRLSSPGLSLPFWLLLGCALSAPVNQ